MMDVRGLDALQLDGLREVANIGAGHAATALSSMTNRRISVSVPEIRIVRLEEVPELLGDPAAPIAAVLMRMVGDAPGRTVQLFPAATASRLAAILLGSGRVDFPGGFGEMEESALKEAGNILVGAYLNGLSEFLGMVLMMSVPELAIDQVGAILSSTYLDFGGDDDFVFCIDTQLEVSEEAEPLPAHFLLVPDIASLEVILKTLRLT